MRDDAGAAIVHWHAIDEFGQPQLDDVTLYGAALDAMQGRLLAYPSCRTVEVDVFPSGPLVAAVRVVRTRVVFD